MAEEFFLHPCHRNFFLLQNNFAYRLELFYSYREMQDQIFLDEEETHHCLQVLRHKAGDEIFVTDGKGKLLRCSIERRMGKEALLTLIELLREEGRPAAAIHIGLAPTKVIDRFEWFIEKATEIGVSAITPLHCRRSERLRLNMERLQKQLIAAMKQSLRLWLPQLNSFTPLEKFISEVRENETQKFIAHCQKDQLPPLQSLYQRGEPVCILIGPEGDFSMEEISHAQANGFSAISLGDHRLRTETAGVVAVHTIKLIQS